MRFTFQKSIVNNQATLPIIAVIALVMWFVLPPVWMQHVGGTSDFGLWRFAPALLKTGWGTVVASVVCMAVVVYQMAELNYVNVLLRVSSRMLSSMLALLLALAVVCHQCQEPGCVLMVLSLITFFPLFETYQQPSPHLSFLIHLPLSAASLLFPKLLWMVPVYWLIQGYFRAFSLRCFTAALMGALLPYWCYGGIAFMTGTLDDYMADVQTLTEFQLVDYAQLDGRNLLTFIFVLLLFLVGTVDFYARQFLDKTRTRIIYNAMIGYGVAIALFMCLQPQYFVTLLPLLLLPTSILFGHFFTLTHTRFSHICCLVLLLLAVVVVTAQYVCDEHLAFRLPTSSLP